MGLPGRHLLRLGGPEDGMAEQPAVVIMMMMLEAVVVVPQIFV